MLHKALSLFKVLNFKVLTFLNDVFGIPVLTEIVIIASVFTESQIGLEGTSEDHVIHTPILSRVT